ncbi:MAG: phosphotransferase enzyme family protein, partial [Saprospiraceae bacterium]
AGAEFYLQRINTKVFSNPQIIQRNIVAMAGHLRARGYPHAALQIRPALDGRLFVWSGQSAWRMFEAIEDACVFDKVQSADQACEAGRFVGEFHSYAGDISPEAIHPALPDFLRFRDRIGAFKAGLSRAESARASQAQTLIAYAFQWIHLPERFIRWQERGAMPRRLIHADPKIGNLLFDAHTTKPKALIDWDTLMPGPCLYDFGDMARSYCNLSEEDYAGPEPVFSGQIYRALEEGYLHSTHSWLNPLERKNLRYAAAVVIYIQFLRFLSDYLLGDMYYRVADTEQNRRRAANQMRLLEGLLAFGL